MRDLKKLGHQVFILRGGFDAWQAANQPVVTDTQNMISRPIDTYLDPEFFKYLTERIRENHAYLNWEVALIDHIKSDPAVRFNLN